MKKLILFFSVILLCGSAARSQSHFGLKAGVNVANQLKTISTTQVPAHTENTKPFLGYQLGVFYKTTLNKYFSLSAETNFSVIGSSSMLMNADGTEHNTHEKLGYIELPVFLQYAVDRVYFGLGPSVGIKVFSKLTNFENRSFNLDYHKTVDAAGNLMAGYVVTKKIDANVRYSYGFLNIYKHPGYASIKNRFINVSVLYTLR